MLDSHVVMPPQIKEYFKKVLLTKPLFLGDNLELMGRMFQYIERVMQKKLINLPHKREKCEKMVKKFEELYELTKKKEEEFKKNTKNSLQRSFYFVKLSDKGAATIFTRLRSKVRVTGSHTSYPKI